jgi:hypothetical protein
MILTHTGKFGDFVPSLIIPNHYYKAKKEKTTFILSQWFKSIVGLEEFLMLQDFTEKVIFDPYMPENFSAGGQPYKFIPENIGDEIYYNLGIGGWPGKYLGEMYAEEYNLGFDKDIKLNFIDENFPEEFRNQKVYTHFYEDRWDKDRYEVTFTQLLAEREFTAFNPEKTLLHNLNLAHYATETAFYPNGFSVLADICNLNFNLTNGSVNPTVYYLNHL